MSHPAWGGPDTERTMIDVTQNVGRQWGWVALRGVVAVLFGLLALCLPGITLAALVLVWGAYALVDGVFALIAGWRIRDQDKPLWPLILVGITGLAAGIVTFLWPGVTALVLLYIIAFWAIVAGVFQIVAAIRFRKEIQNEWLHGLSGLVSLLFGLMLLIQPGAGALALVWVIGIYAVFFGILLLALAWRLKRHAA
ncbi:acid-resistance membrane protein [Bordetella pseudohinzii]|uniref:Acid-resistance membrane protein n=2 Tax=Bordetella pseudohinzii TaxID=1331258 RepID=A0A0M7I5S3_9BORD|nr:acid-resistance membrane protein [Bordetella pseudohinzii]